MIPVDADTMRAIAPHFSGRTALHQAAIIAGVGKVLAATLDEFDINTRLRIAHFLAQTCHESAGFRTTEEFASGRQYENRKDLGNVHPGDGPRYKGRGLLQLTGRANYRTVGGLIKVDLEGHPEKAAEPELSLRIACVYWQRRKINGPCDSDDIITVTKRVNGGLNGLAERRQFLKKAKAAIAHLEERNFPAPAAGADPILRRGSEGEDVGELQALLRSLGFQIGIDQDFGPAAEVAVMKFQSDQGLKADGIVGPRTWQALRSKAQPKMAEDEDLDDKPDLL